MAYFLLSLGQACLSLVLGCWRKGQIHWQTHQEVRSCLEIRSWLKREVTAPATDLCMPSLLCNASAILAEGVGTLLLYATDTFLMAAGLPLLERASHTQSASVLGTSTPVCIVVAWTSRRSREMASHIVLDQVSQ